MVKKPGGIPVTGGILTTEPRKMNFKRNWKARVLWLLVMVAIAMGGRSAGPADIVLWNSDRTLILYREGPFRGMTLEYAIRQFVEEINDKGMEIFIAQRRNQLDDSKWV
jgi:hypothetical protein